MEELQATGFAFAAILSDGSIVAWGTPELGGDSSAVQDQLRKVQRVQGSWVAYTDTHYIN